MRKFVVIISLFMSLCASAQIKWNQAYQQYFDQYKDIAIEQMLKYHIPETEDMIEGIADATFILNGGYKVLDHDEVVQILKASM